MAEGHVGMNRAEGDGGLITFDCRLYPHPGMPLSWKHMVLVHELGAVDWPGWERRTVAHRDERARPRAGPHGTDCPAHWEARLRLLPVASALLSGLCVFQTWLT